MERMEGVLEHMAVVQKNEREDQLERAKEKEQERQKKEEKERKFYDGFKFSDKEYHRQIAEMNAEEYFGDVEMKKSSSLPKFRAKNKPVSSKERKRRALKKQKEEEKESAWMTIGTLLY